MVDEEFENRYCSQCDCDVLAVVTCSYAVGQEGGIVIAKSFCLVCNHIIHERLVDKDI